MLLLLQEAPQNSSSGLAKPRCILVDCQPFHMMTARQQLELNGMSRSLHIDQLHLRDSARPALQGTNAFSSRQQWLAFDTSDGIWCRSDAASSSIYLALTTYFALSSYTGQLLVDVLLKRRLVLVSQHLIKLVRVQCA